MNDLPPPAHLENISTLPDSIDRLLREAHQKVADRHDIASLESDIESLRIEARTIRKRIWCRKGICNIAAENAEAIRTQRVRRTIRINNTAFVAHG